MRKGHPRGESTHFGLALAHNTWALWWPTTTLEVGAGPIGAWEAITPHPEGIGAMQTSPQLKTEIQTKSRLTVYV